MDDYPSMHLDFQKIPCPDNAAKDVLGKLESTLFDEESPGTSQEC